MNLELVEKLADAVLYEGYIIYPYRPSAVKNLLRSKFGWLAPQAYSAAQSNENRMIQTECLVLCDETTTLDLRVRFLHLRERDVCELISPKSVSAEGAPSEYRRVVSLEIDGQVRHTWQEAIEREVRLPDLNLSKLGASPTTVNFYFSSERSSEPLHDADGAVRAMFIREQKAIVVAVELHITDCKLPIAEPSSRLSLRKITARILNLTPLENADQKSRDEALMRSLVSTHTILSLRGGEFVSLLEPPDAFKAAAADCCNIGTWPVLVGEAGERDLMLSSPIILYDYPQVAPESAGNFFDGTEIDEMLALRVMTLTDDEKREMRGVDEHARRILERTETLPEEHLLKLHGVLRGLRKIEME